MPISENLLAATGKFQDWLQHQALPLWSTTGIETDSYGSYERLLANGEPDLHIDRRVRVNCRQIFVFSCAAEMGWIDNAPQLVDGLNQYLQTYASHPNKVDGMYVHLLSNNNQVIDQQQDLYNIAFYLLGATYTYRLTQDPRALQQANNLLAHIESTLQAPGGWLEGDYPFDARRQNPHMHLFEAFMALYETTGDGKWLAKAGEIFCLFETRFFDHQHQVLKEYFTLDWRIIDDHKGLIVEPGHMMEWVWLLRKYSELTATPVDHYCQALYQNSLSLGQDPESGLLYDEVTHDGKILKTSKRCWPVTELLKANIAQAKAGHQECEEAAAQAIDMLFNYYISDQLAGSYVDQLDENNQVVMELAPASTLYHFMLACTEAVKYCQPTSENHHG